MRKWVIGGITVLVLAVIGIVVGLSVGGGSGSGPHKPALHPAPGKYRLTPQLPGNGAPPQPRLLTNGATRVLVAFGGVVRQDGRARAALTVSLPGSDQRTAGRYGPDAVIHLGAARVTVLAVYDEPGTDDDAVDLQVAAS
ncbi:MAG TPA: hypothetical protein VHC23_01950 [Jatrophihabitans sp.]|nr:hypothetical protein [Jatrophihabitans sp.]